MQRQRQAEIQAANAARLAAQRAENESKVCDAGPYVGRMLFQACCSCCGATCYMHPQAARQQLLQLQQQGEQLPRQCTLERDRSAGMASALKGVPSAVSLLRAKHLQCCLT